jgi:isopentenyl-diphosphate delta-isomerase
MNEPEVILVDKFDIQTGTIGKLEAHKKGLLHRAISVFIFTSSGEWIMQRRALDKYHSNGLWTNTCCSHPVPGEANIDAAHRRLMEEMGLKCELKPLFTFSYKVNLENDLIEHEFDHIFMGISDDEPVINTDEVLDWKRMNFNQLQNDIQVNPEHFTYWFRQIYQKVNDSINAGKILS